MTLAKVSHVILAALALVGIGTVLGRAVFGAIAVENETAELKEKIAVLEREQTDIKLVLKQIARKLKISY